MNHRMDDPRLDAIVAFCRRSTKGASVRVLKAVLKHEVPRRTLQSWLARLVTARRLKVRGAGRGTRYYVPEAVARPVAVPSPTALRLSPSVPPAPPVPASSGAAQPIPRALTTIDFSAGNTETERLTTEAAAPELAAKSVMPRAQSSPAPVPPARYPQRGIASATAPSHAAIPSSPPKTIPVPSAPKPVPSPPIAPAGSGQSELEKWFGSFFQ